MNRERLLKIFVIAVAVLAAAVGVLAFFFFTPTQLDGGWETWGGLVTLVGVVVAAELGGIRFSSGRALLSAALIPIVATVPLFGPAIAIAATAVSEGLARFALRQPLIKWVFNTAQFTLAIGVGALVYHALGGPISAQSFDLDQTVVPFAALVVVYFLINTWLVSTVVGLDTGRRISDVWREFSGIAFANDLASSSLALFVVYGFAELGLGGLYVVLLPLLFVHHSYNVYLQLQKQNKEILELLVKTIEAKDPYTSGHSQRVAKLSREISETLGLGSRAVEEIETAALLHDIGKIDFAYSDFITSPAVLSAREKEIMHSHPTRGADLLTSISSLSKTVLDGVRHHHEHFDGNGYPDGLVGHDIPLPARIIMVADTVDAMLSDRPYRSALSVEKVLAELREFSGHQFDPTIVEEFIDAGLVHAAVGRAKARRVQTEDKLSVPTSRVHSRSASAG